MMFSFKPSSLNSSYHIALANINIDLIVALEYVSQVTSFKKPCIFSLSLNVFLKSSKLRK